MRRKHPGWHQNEHVFTASKEASSDTWPLSRVILALANPRNGSISCDTATTPCVFDKWKQHTRRRSRSPRALRPGDDKDPAAAFEHHQHRHCVGRITRLCKGAPAALHKQEMVMELQGLPSIPYRSSGQSGAALGPVQGCGRRGCQRRPTPHWAALGGHPDYSRGMH
jgi:hypothetical protein